MKYVVRISSIIFRAGLLLYPIGTFIGSVLVGAAGHNSHFSKSDYWVFVFCVVTFLVLTAYENFKMKTNGSVWFSLALILSLTSFIYLIYFLADTLFSGEYKSESSQVFFGLIIFFTVINFIVLTGLILDRKTPGVSS